MPDIFVSDESKIDATVKHPPAGESKHKLPGHRHSPLAAFCYYPDGVNFETKERQEKVILLLRRHPITNVPWIVTAILLLLAPQVLDFFPILAFLPDRFQFIAVIGWYLITTAFILENFLNWFFNVNIITDERIIDIDFHNLIYKEVSDAKVEQIQDKTYNMGGVIRTIFNYGDVSIQTAAEKREFDFSAVPKPDLVVRILNDLLIEEEQEKIDGRVR